MSKATAGRQVRIVVTANQRIDTPRSFDTGILYSTSKLAQPGFPQVE
nr:hypothetical protein [Microseira wollei]